FLPPKTKTKQKAIYKRAFAGYNTHIQTIFIFRGRKKTMGLAVRKTSGYRDLYPPLPVHEHNK
ncbi:hypothetical protein ACKWMU_05955, partial [Escherichia coli]|uniref:hypothetical protein n=1 Tax=Escherichia coli TaxID=562 RepID=UPI0039046DB2